MAGKLTTAWRGRAMRLSDALVLIGMIAVALAIYRSAPRVFGAYPTVPRLFAGLATMLLLCQVIYLFLRLRQPRPPRWRLARQPGFAACLAAFAGALLWFVAIAVLLYVGNPPRGVPGGKGNFWNAVLVGGPVTIATAVIAAWMLLAFSGLRNPERGWIDPLGRILGAGWVAVWVLGLVFLWHCAAWRPPSFGGPPGAGVSSAPFNGGMPQ